MSEAPRKSLLHHIKNIQCNITSKKSKIAHHDLQVSALPSEASLGPLCVELPSTMSGATAASADGSAAAAARPDPSARKEEEEEGEGRRRRMRRPRVAINSIELLDGDDDAAERGGPDGAAVAPGQGGCRGWAEGGFCAEAS